MTLRSVTLAYAVSRRPPSLPHESSTPNATRCIQTHEIENQINGQQHPSDHNITNPNIMPVKPHSQSSSCRGEPAKSMWGDPTSARGGGPVRPRNPGAIRANSSVSQGAASRRIGWPSVAFTRPHFARFKARGVVDSKEAGRQLTYKA